MGYKNDNITWYMTAPEMEECTDGYVAFAMVQETPAVVEIQQVCGAGGLDFYLKRKGQGGRAVGAAFPSCPALCGYSSVVISFASVGRHFPKNMALQSENPNR